MGRQNKSLLITQLFENRPHLNSSDLEVIFQKLINFPPSSRDVILYSVYVKCISYLTRRDGLHK